MFINNSTRTVHAASEVVRKVLEADGEALDASNRYSEDVSEFIRVRINENFTPITEADEPTIKFLLDQIAELTEPLPGPPGGMTKVRWDAVCRAKRKAHRETLDFIIGTYFHAEEETE